jgi:predicted nucleic acid-binding protein
LVYYLEKVQPYRAWLEPVIESVVAGSRSAVLSVIAEAELLVLPLRLRNRDALDRVERLLEHPSITIRRVDRELARHAASVRAGLNLRLVDSIIVATAAVSGCDALIGNDQTCARRVTEIPYVYLEESVTRGGHHDTG